MLFHDTGYLKEINDTQGTGAKYTSVHVNRSIAFARNFLKKKGYSAGEVLSIQNMIRCTGINANMTEIPFQSQMERLMGCALASADLLGQMAAADYVEKLPILYQEFSECAEIDPKGSAWFSGYASAEDLMRKTPDFWEHYVLPRLTREFGCLFKFLNQPYPAGPNPYVEAIERNLARIRKLLSSGPAA